MASSGGPRLGQIERYGAASQVTTPTELSVAGGFVNKIAVEPPWVAGIDLADSKNNDNRRLNLGNHNVAGCSSTSSGFPAIHAVDLAIDADRGYWLENETGGTSSLKALPLTDTLTATQAPTQLVSGLGVVNALAVDEHHVYFTTRDRGGAIFYVARDTVTTRTAAEVSVLAEDRGEPFAIAASADSPWIYWATTGETGTVERARKPLD